jgi:UbiD family decarboxylase
MVTRVSRQVDPRYELASLAVQSEKKKEAVFFESLKGHTTPVVTNLYSEVERICLAFGIGKEELHEWEASSTRRG